MLEIVPREAGEVRRFHWHWYQSPLFRAMIEVLLRAAGEVRRLRWHWYQSLLFSATMELMLRAAGEVLRLHWHWCQSPFFKMEVLPWAALPRDRLPLNNIFSYTQTADKDTGEWWNVVYPPECRYYYTLIQWPNKCGLVQDKKVNKTSIIKWLI